MDFKGQIAVVTGAGAGIGAALARELAARGAEVVVTDLNGDTARAVAAEIGGHGRTLDVADGAAIKALIEEVEADIGPIALFCSNAGIATGFDLSFDNAGGASDAVWDKAWQVNVMAHVHAARALVPLMKARGGGTFLNTASAAGLLSQLGSATYSTTKHAAVGFAENLAITHRDDGIRVSVLCPQGVDTDMIAGMNMGPLSKDGVLSPDNVAKVTCDGLAKDQFMILPHEQVLSYMQNKAQDYERWLGGMASLQRHVRAANAE
ncbi:SDR family oxidoreductase [Phaeobacter sp. CNT1-3]|nr:SDR family oxidoreductase [Phaeobacter sp. CNT1-3]